MIIGIMYIHREDHREEVESNKMLTYRTVYIVTLPHASAPYQYRTRNEPVQQSLKIHCVPV